MQAPECSQAGIAVDAEKIVASDKNLLAIVGYQDEESPGRRLMDLIDLPDSERTIALNDHEHRVRCKVEKFGSPPMPTPSASSPQ